MSLVNTAIAADNFGYSPSTLADAYFYLMSAPSPGDPRSVLDYEYPGRSLLFIFVVQCLLMRQKCSSVPVNSRVGLQLHECTYDPSST